MGHRQEVRLFSSCLFLPFFVFPPLLSSTFHQSCLFSSISCSRLNPDVDQFEMNACDRWKQYTTTELDTGRVHTAPGREREACWSYI